MTKRLDGTVGSQDYNSLFAGTTPTPLVSVINVARAAKDIPAGTVLVKISSDTAYAPATAALTSEDLVLVLAEDIEAGSGNVSVPTYKTGNFARTRLCAGGSYTLTANDYDYLRQAGIQSENVID